MTNFFKVLSNLIQSLAQARAASILARQGRVEEAKKVYD